MPGHPWPHHRGRGRGKPVGEGGCRRRPAECQLGAEYEQELEELKGSLIECTSDVCITCGDIAVAMRIIEVDEARCLALCEAPDGRRSTVEIALVEAAPGDEVLVHAGTAIA